LLLAVGHVTWDRHAGGDLLGGSVTYAAHTARKLGWDVAVITAAGADFDAARDLPGVKVVTQHSNATTRFENRYGSDGTRQQTLLSRADRLSFDAIPGELRRPDALLLGSVAGEIPPGSAFAFEAGVVGALGQGWLRAFADGGAVTAQDWPNPARDLEGVHVLFLSIHDVAGDVARARRLLEYVPMIALTRGWEGLDLLTRDSVQSVASLPRVETDPTGAGDVFAAAFLVRYHECQDPLAAAAFAACAASCAVEGVGSSALGDRQEVERRMLLRDRLVEEGEWDE
jgi:sugar/nucleoside kinase (ribokinase family)